MRDLSLYIHIPFCVSKCFYCDFSSFANKNNKVEAYISSLIKELDLYRERLGAYNIRTIFIGGGTPSSIDGRYIYKILDYINKYYNTSGLIETSIEVNPGTIDGEKIKTYREIGINRVSMGVQSFNDKLLKAIGRTHTSKDIYKSYDLIGNAGIENVNMDLIFGLPNQKIEDVLFSLEEASRLGVKHISHYGLIIEEGTPFYSLYNEGKLNIPSEEEERQAYHLSNDFLKDKGYKHYEISNYSLENYESRHNLVYWDLLPYLGLGLSSHSYMDNKRFYNTSDINKYIDLLNNKKLPILGEEIIDRNTEIEEFCILALRKIPGINKKDFKKRFKQDIKEIYGNQIEKHKKNKLIVEEEDFISLSKLGLDLSNQVEIDFLR